MDKIDLEAEFKKLMSTLVEDIEYKQRTGKFHADYGDQLIAMVKDRIHLDITRYGEKCPDGHTHDYCGWSPSMGYHC